MCYLLFPFCAFILLDLGVVERSLVQDFLSLPWERPPVVATCVDLILLVGFSFPVCPALILIVISG
jgi:hypothetical protein